MLDLLVDSNAQTLWDKSRVHSILVKILLSLIPKSPGFPGYGNFVFQLEVHIGVLEPFPLCTEADFGTLL